MWCPFTGTAGSNPALSASPPMSHPPTAPGRLRRALPALWALGTVSTLSTLGACRTHRILEVTSNPPGALVRLDEEVVGRTPLEHEFQHYGRRRLTLYLDGYRVWSERLRLTPPWYSRFPLDIVTQVLVPMGLTDRHRIDVRLWPDTGSAHETRAEVESFVERATALRRAGGEPPGP